MNLQILTGVHLSGAGVPLAACAVPERRDANVFLIGVSATMPAPQGVKP